MTTANMGLTLPNVSVTPGPTWASQINSDLTLIDQHNHTIGLGAQIPTAGLRIDADLRFNSTTPNGLAAVGLSYLGLISPQTPPVSASVFSDVVGNLYYRNTDGVDVQLTIGNSIAGTAGSISGLPSGTASANYDSVTGAFVWSKATTQGATMDSGPLRLRNGSSGSDAVTISPAAGTSNYALTLPSAAPASQSILTAASNGACAFTAVNSTLTLSSSLLKVADLGITVAQLALDAVETPKIKDGAVTPQKIQTKTVAYSDTVAIASTSNTVPTNAFNLECSFTALAGKPICIELLSSGGTYTDSSITAIADDAYAYIYALAPNLAYTSIASVHVPANSLVPVSTLRQVIISPTAGTYVFRVRFNAGPAGGAEVQVTNSRLIAYLL